MPGTLRPASGESYLAKSNMSSLTLTSSSYNRAGDFNTVFEDYARTCASFARTAITEDYTGKPHPTPPITIA